MTATAVKLGLGSPVASAAAGPAPAAPVPPQASRRTRPDGSGRAGTRPAKRNAAAGLPAAGIAPDAIEGADVPAWWRFVVEIPGLRLVTLSNGPAFRKFAKAKVSRDQHLVVGQILRTKAVRFPVRPPLTVTITRCAFGRMDSDNATIAAKFVRDAVARYLGIDDRHEHLVDYVVRQEKAPKGSYAVRIEIAPRGR